MFSSATGNGLGVRKAVPVETWSVLGVYLYDISSQALENLVIDSYPQARAHYWATSPSWLLIS